MHKAKQRFSMILLLTATMLFWHMLPFNTTTSVMAISSHQEEPPPVPEVISEEVTTTNQPDQATTVITVTLTGAAEVPEAGDGDGSGTAVLTFDTTGNTVCYSLVHDGIDAPTMAHIHEGAEGVSGSAVVTLFSDGEAAAEGCATPEDGTIQQILDSPAGYYVNVHNESFPGGAIRGQLSEEDVDAPADEGEDTDTPGEEGEDVDTPGEEGEDTDTPGEEGEDTDMSGEEDTDMPGEEGEDTDMPGEEDTDTPGEEGEDTDTPGENTNMPGEEGEDVDTPSEEGEDTEEGEDVDMPSEEGEDTDTSDKDSDDMDMPEHPASMAITVTLTGGDTEVPDPGDPDGTGTAILTFDTISNTVCYELTTADIVTPTMAHIHEGVEGESGSGVVTLFENGVDADEGCADSDAETVKTILENSTGYYVNVHNEEFPGGAIRGQLPEKMHDMADEEKEETGDTDMPDEGDDETDTPVATSMVITVTLTGATEVPDSGDPDGTGTAILTFDTISNTVCYELTTADIVTPTMAHIHEGIDGESGSAVVTLFENGENIESGCVTPESETARSTVQEGTIIEKILADLAGYYVNVHNEDFSGGAIRGQLSQPVSTGVVAPEAPSALSVADEPLEYSVYLPLTVR